MNCATASLSRASSGRRRLSTNVRVKPSTPAASRDEQLGHAALAQAFDQAVAAEHRCGVRRSGATITTWGRAAASGLARRPRCRAYAARRCAAPACSPNFSVVSCDDRDDGRIASRAARAVAAALARGARTGARRRPARSRPAPPRAGAALDRAAADGGRRGGGAARRAAQHQRPVAVGRAGEPRRAEQIGSAPIVACAEPPPSGGAPSSPPRLRRSAPAVGAARGDDGVADDHPHQGNSSGTDATSPRCRADRRSSRCRRARPARRSAPAARPPPARGPRSRAARLARAPLAGPPRANLASAFARVPIAGAERQQPIATAVAINIVPTIA